eukprot:314397_1
MATPLTRCVACWDELTLAELAHSPCKHCHVEFCNDCLTRAFEIAQRDDVLEVHCPNPHCKKLLNAESMQIQTTTIKQWVHQELTHPKYGVLDEYKEKNWDLADIVHYIINTRKRDLTHVRRKSSVWEDQLTKLKLRAKADLCDVPLAPVLYANQSNDRIDLRSKFTSKMTRSQSVPNVNIADRKIQLFKTFIEDDLDDDELQTDTDFSDSEEAIRPSSGPGQAGNRRLINAIIDEDAELNDCFTSDQFRFPDNLSGHSSPYDRTSPYMNSMLSKKSSDMTMISISESSQSVPNNHTTESLPKDHHQKNRLSAFRAMFSNKAVSADSVKKKKDTQRINTRSRAASGHTEPKQRDQTRVRHARRSTNSRIMDMFSKTKHKKNTKKNDHESSKKAPVTPRGIHHVKRHSLTLEAMRSITPDPAPSRTKRSNSHAMGNVAPRSPPPPLENRLSLSYQKQLIQFNIQKKKNTQPHLSPDAAGPQLLPGLVSLKSKSAPADALGQLSPPTSSREQSTSELSTSGPFVDIDRLPVLDTRRDVNSNSCTPYELRLAPISSAKELELDLDPNDESLSIENIDHDMMMDINTNADADDENESSHSSEELEHVPSTFMTDACTNDTNTISNTGTMPIPASPNIMPFNPKPIADIDALVLDEDDGNELSPVNVTLLEEVERFEIERDEYRKNTNTNTITSNTEPQTPATPPTPDSPNSCSLTDHSHYERAMRNMDAAIARQSIKTTPMNPMQQESNKRNDSDKQHHDPPPPEEDGGCNGCHACVVL